MYTAYIGKRLIELYNQREHTQHTAATFYKEVYFPLFFDDERYLQLVNNSWFDQAYMRKKKTPLSAEVRAEALKKQLTKIENDTPDGSFYLGGAAAESTAKTSGQVNNLTIAIPTEDVYASWIGDALGIGVAGKGNLSFLVDSDEVILTIYDGWQLYRKFMKDTPSLKAHQVNTWNGWWLINAFSNRFDPSHPFRKQPIVDIKEGVSSLKAQSWLQVIFALAQKLLLSTTAYVYSFGKMNTTLGFVQLQLNEIKRIISKADLYNLLTGDITGIDNLDSLSKIYETQFGFERACLQGAIGIRALEPAKLREHMPGFKGPAKPFKNVQENHLYKIYEIWIIAMLNNEQLLQKAQDLAEALTEYSQGERGKKTNAQNVSNFLNSSTRRDLLSHATKLIEEMPVAAHQLDEVCDDLFKLPKQDFPLFMALLRLKYAVAEAKQTV